MLLGCHHIELNIPDLEKMDRILIVGSNLRNEHPLLAQRIRKAVANGAELCFVNPLGDDPLMKVTHKAITSPNNMVNVMAQILKAMSGLQRLSLCLPKSLSDLLETVSVWDNTQAMAESLAGHGKDYDLISPRTGIFLGNIAQHNQRFTELYSLSEAIASLCGATFGLLASHANSTGAHLVGAMPIHTGLNAKAMLEAPRKAYLLLNIEPELDCQNASVAKQAMAQAECVVALTSYKSEALRDAHVLLPIAPFTETSGTFMSMEGRVQSFKAVTKPLGECRPAWKVLRVLANTFGLNGFEFDSSEQVKDEIFGGEKPSKVVWRSLNNNLRELIEIQVMHKTNVLQRIGEVSQYHADPVVRRSPPLQKTKYMSHIVAAMNAEQLAKLNLKEGDAVIAKQAGGTVQLVAKIDNRVARGCVRIAGAQAEAAGLGELMGDIEVMPA